MPAPSDWLRSTLAAVREQMRQRLENAPDDPELERDLQMALDELEVMWEELEGQAERLQRESERYQEFFEHAPDAYLITDSGCNIREANRAAAELLALDRAHLLGHPLTRFIREEDRTLFLSKFIGLVLEPTGKSMSWACRLQPAEGDAASVVVSVRAIPLRKSGVAGLCWLIRPA
jgi:PAS domain S-box-containing protein